MEWSKIKNILIIALILINVLLLWLIHHQEAAETETLSPAPPLAQTLSVLETNGIQVQADMDTSEKTLPMLTLTFREDNGDHEYAPVEDRIYLSEDSALAAANDFIRALGTFGELGRDIRAERITPSEEYGDCFTVSYGGYYENYRIKEMQVVCTVSSHGVLKMEEQWADVSVAGQNRRSLIPVTTALLHYMDRVCSQEDGVPKTVTDISLAYTVDTPYEGAVASDTAFPAWRIEASDGSAEYIPAYP